MRDKDQVLLENLYSKSILKEDDHYVNLNGDVVPDEYNNSQDKKSKLETLKTKIRYAMKTNNKAELSFAQEELYQLATRFNLMKDPEVLELLADSDVAHVTGNRQ